jgi:membrane protease YdiL (CAAX protease family)
MNQKSNLIRSNSLLIIRTTVIGFLVSSLGIGIWAILATFLPMPWPFLLMIGILFIYLKYFSGSWWPKSTQQVRKENFRRLTLSPTAWKWSLLAAFFIVVIEQSGMVVTFRIIEFPAEIFITEYRFLAQLPAWAAWLTVIMISLVAGICEETGYRGYMQQGLEKRFGPVIGITIVSIMFVIIHLHQAWSGAAIGLSYIFFISVLLGSLAYFSKSLIPGIIAHVSFDILNFSFWWSDLGNQFSAEIIATTGIDTNFILWVAVFLCAVISFIYVLFRLKQNHIQAYSSLLYPKEKPI